MVRLFTTNDSHEVGRISPVPRTRSPLNLEASTRTTNTGSVQIHAQGMHLRTG